ncbi:hypothetical protein C5928_19695 [Escherichia coli O153:H12]|nr:hypothetical protein [Escherichia coli O153:H12]
MGLVYLVLIHWLDFFYVSASDLRYMMFPQFAPPVPALVLAATWFDNAARDADIIRRNAITHPGFVPVIPLKVPVQ